MLRKSLLHAFFIYFIGIITGIQLALYLFDYYDDGVADIKSMLIGLGMLVLSISYIIYRQLKKGRATGSA